MKLAARAGHPEEKRLLDHLEAHASPALREKIAALPVGAPCGLDAAWRYIEGEAKKRIGARSGYVDDEIVFGWLVHYYEDVAPSLPVPATKTQKNQPPKKAEGKSRDVQKVVAGSGSSAGNPATPTETGDNRPGGVAGSAPPSSPPPPGPARVAVQDSSADGGRGDGGGLSFALFASDEEGPAA